MTKGRRDAVAVELSSQERKQRTRKGLLAYFALLLVPAVNACIIFSKANDKIFDVGMAL